MEIITTLEKLGFSFWQLLIVGFAVALRHEIRFLFSRLASVKVGDKEIAFHYDYSVSDLKAVKEQLEQQPANPELAIGLIEAKIDKKLISALASIKRETRFLWPEMELLVQKEAVEAEIQEDTLARIREQLNFIEEAGLLTYVLEHVGPSQYGIHSIQIKKLDKGLERLISTVSNNQIQ